MIVLEKKSDCCGCYACANICPKSCIEMKSDKEGFYYPSIDNEKCVNCRLCEKVCPSINNLISKEIKRQAYACRSIDDEIIKNSSSGGIFTLLCNEIIEKHGVVFGAAFDENFDVFHTYGETYEECKKFRGSKYVQSKIGNTYKSAKEFLESGRKVLFSGTQCQIKGLNLFLQKEYDNLITVEIICHGVPSPKVFDLYKKSLEEKHHSNIISIDFRNKSRSWANYDYVTEFENEDKQAEVFWNNIYMKGFLSNIYLRPSCYECKAKNFSSGSDISLGDYWGVEKIHPEFNDDKGTSLLFINSQKGFDLLRELMDKMMIKSTDADYAINNNPCIVKPTAYNIKRKKFFENLDENKIEESIFKFVKDPLIKKLKSKIKNGVLKIRKCIS